MKKKIQVFFAGIFILLISQAAIAQKDNLTLNFSAEHIITSGFIALDSLYIENTTAGCDTTLYDASPHIMFSFLGIDNLLTSAVNNQHKLYAFPNPLVSDVTIEAEVPENGVYNIAVYNPLGQLEKLISKELKTGKHSFHISLSQSGIHHCILSNKNYSASVKLLNFGNKQSANTINYNKPNSQDAAYSSANLKNTLFADGFEFTPGDMLQIVAYAFNYLNDTLNTAPIQTSDIIFSMEPVSGCPSEVHDFDGNIYSTTNINGQCWMAENLKTTHFSDGTEIPVAASYSIWTSLTINDPGYCYYGNDSSNIANYGFLYNWAAAMNGDTSSTANPSETNGICPTGWHLPGDVEWDELGEYIANAHGGMTNGYSFTSDAWKKVGKHLKSTTGWGSGNGTDDYFFNGLSGGYRAYSGTYTDIDVSSNWWAATEFNSTLAWGWGLEDSSHKFLHLTLGYKSGGYSVRCIKD